jgi:hypothetical protein
MLRAFVPLRIHLIAFPPTRESTRTHSGLSYGVAAENHRDVQHRKYRAICGYLVVAVLRHAPSLRTSCVPSQPREELAGRMASRGGSQRVRGASNRYVLGLPQIFPTVTGQEIGKEDEAHASSLQLTISR